LYPEAGHVPEPAGEHAVYVMGVVEEMEDETQDPMPYLDPAE